jgi:hypothetical protein
MSTCSFNMAELPAEDLCMRPATWHIRMEIGFSLESCDLHFGRALRPERIVIDDGEWQHTDSTAESFHPYGTMCGQPDTWWILDHNTCMSEEDAVRLGYAEYVD